MANLRLNFLLIKRLNCSSNTHTQRQTDKIAKHKSRKWNSKHNFIHIRNSLTSLCRVPFLACEAASLWIYLMIVHRYTLEYKLVMLIGNDLDLS